MFHYLTSTSHYSTKTTSSPTQQAPLPDTCSDFTNLVHLLHTKCPQEIIDIIQTHVLESIFRPGCIKLSHHSLPRINVEHYSNPPTFLLLNKALYAQYHTRFWSENSFLFYVPDPQTENRARRPAYPLGRGIRRGFDWLFKREIPRRRCAYPLRGPAADLIRKAGGLGYVWKGSRCVTYRKPAWRLEMEAIEQVGVFGTKDGRFGKDAVSLPGVEGGVL
ncbi:MAG: hypothetical protein Q9170_003704 [Blastenia crenularia]